MFKRVAAVPIAALLLWGAQDKKTVSASIALPLIETAEPSEFCQMPPTLEERAAYQESIAAYRQRAAPAPAPAKEARQGSPPGWPGAMPKIGTRSRVWSVPRHDGSQP